MAEGILTEREWRKKSARMSRRNPPCWGAQCMMAPVRRGLTQDRRLHALLIMLSFTTALIIPFATPAHKAEAQPTLLAMTAEPAVSVAPRTVSSVEYGMPSGFAYLSRTFGQEELLRGKLLLIDSQHPLPQGVPAPNTMSIANYGKGMVPVADLTIKSGKETISALTRMFAGLRGKGAGGLVVCRGAMTRLEQREWRLERMRYLAANMPLNEAARQTLAETDAPGMGELQQEFTVEIMMTGERRGKDGVEQSVTLMHTAWRYGFIPMPISEGQLYRCRYVGEAHATAMTYLDLDIKAYLELLHDKQALQVRRDSNRSYLILCKPMNGAYVEFSYPEGAGWEVSLDNMGYAIMACTIQS